MNQKTDRLPEQAWLQPAAPPRQGLRGLLERIVDAGLIGVPLLTPWFMGGRHPLGELVLVTLAVVVAISWLADQALARREVTIARTRAEWLLLGGIALVIVQMLPLPQALLDMLSPHTRQLLPLWRGSTTLAGSLGNWNQVSMTPDWTQAGLILLLSYGMLFTVAAQRLKRMADVERMLGWIAGAVALQAAFGIVQYLTSNGKFVWIYQHPFRETYNAVMGAYMNKNHFAHLMALGIGPLVWLVATTMQPGERSRQNGFDRPSRSAAAQSRTTAALLALAITLFAGLMTMSRGGAAAMFVASVSSVVAL
ncbi:MAG TPA: hypothetical protein VG433_04685, partial [Pirellulales bacterium]|nr:hypothetical protein [Pirellulales bacterium]